jgi:protein TonB
MDAFDPGQTLQRTWGSDRGGDRCSAPDGEARARDVRRGRPPLPPAERPPEPRETDDGTGSRMPLVLMASLGAHALAGAVLAALPAIVLPGPAETIEIEVLALPPEPAAAPPPPVVAPPPPPPEPIVRTVRPPRERVEPEIAPLPEVPAVPAPPDLDEVFGEPAAPLETMAAEGTGFAMPAGSPDGRAGGVAGGHGLGGVAAAPVGPTGDEIRRARRDYARRVRELLQGNASYPMAARVQRLQGRVELALRIGRDGRLVGARVATSSGYSVLDDAAIASAHGLGSFPAPPSLVPWDASEELRTSLQYQLTR